MLHTHIHTCRHTYKHTNVHAFRVRCRSVKNTKSSESNNSKRKKPTSPCEELPPGIVHATQTPQSRRNKNLTHASEALSACNRCDKNTSKPPLVEHPCDVFSITSNICLHSGRPPISPATSLRPWLPSFENQDVCLQMFFLVFASMQLCLH